MCWSQCDAGILWLRHCLGRSMCKGLGQDAGLWLCCCVYMQRALKGWRGSASVSGLATLNRLTFDLWHRSPETAPDQTITKSKSPDIMIDVWTIIAIRQNEAWKKTRFKTKKHSKQWIKRISYKRELLYLIINNPHWWNYLNDIWLTWLTEPETDEWPVTFEQAARSARIRYLIRFSWP